jgi:uncharacterized protein (DUF58 family)
MKLLRFLFNLLMPVFLFLGMYTGMRLWYILLWAQVLLVLVIFGLNQWTLRTFSYTQTLDADSGVKGSETVLHLSVRNEKPFPLSMMRLEVELAAPSENTQVSFSLLPFAGTEFDFRVAMPYRGLYPIGVTTVRVTDVFGLLPMRFDMRRLHYYRQPELLVYPRAEAPSALYADVADEKLFGERYLLNAESGSSISGARAYRPGDPLKQIHWKKSAAHGELFVKQYEQPIRENITVLLDNCAHGRTGEEALARADTVCEAAACVTLHCLSRNRTASLQALCGTRGIHAGEEARSLGDYDKLRRWLALLPFDETPHTGPLPRDTAPGSALILVTGGYDETLEEAVAGAEGWFSSVTLVLVGEGHRDPGLIPALRLPVGCDAAAEMAALE